MYVAHSPMDGHHTQRTPLSTPAGGVCDGVNVRWNTKKWTLTLHVGPSKKMRAARDKCRGSRHAGAIPALAVKHFPGHFEALVPERDGDIVWIEYARRART